jgi:hypothetical protein
MRDTLNLFPESGLGFSFFSRPHLHDADITKRENAGTLSSEPFLSSALKDSLKYQTAKAVKCHIQSPQPMLY